MDYPSQEWQEWVSTLSELSESLTSLHAKRAIWRVYVEQLNQGMAAPADAPFHNWIIRNYVEAVTIGIRRLVDDTPGVQSMIKLLERISLRSGEITRRRYASFYKQAGLPGGDAVAAAEFLRLTGNEESLPAEMPRTDANELKSRIRLIQEWVNSRVAHTSGKMPAEDRVTYADVDVALDALEEVVRKYTLLLTGSSLLKSEPVFAQRYETAIARLFGRESPRTKNRTQITPEPDSQEDEPREEGVHSEQDESERQLKDEALSTRLGSGSSPGQAPDSIPEPTDQVEGNTGVASPGSKSPTPLNDPVLFLAWIAILLLSGWFFFAAMDKGWVVGIPIVIALGGSRALWGKA